MKANNEIVRKYYKYILAEKDFYFAENGNYYSSGCSSGSVTSNNKIQGGANAYVVGQNHSFAIGYSYTDTIPATIYTFQIAVTGQGNGYIKNPTVTINYSDETSEIVYSKQNWSGNSLDEVFTFEASKPIKSIEGAGLMTHSSVNYVGVYLHLTSLTYIAKVAQETTSSDYDYYEDVNVYRIPKIDGIFYGITG